jgi:hypothetical protein
LEGNCIDDEYQDEELLHTHPGHIDVQAHHLLAIRDIVSGGRSSPINLNNEGAISRLCY